MNRGVDVDSILLDTLTVSPNIVNLGVREPTTMCSRKKLIKYKIKLAFF